MRKKLLVVGGGAMIILAFCIGTTVALTCKKAKEKPVILRVALRI